MKATAAAIVGGMLLAGCGGADTRVAAIPPPPRALPHSTTGLDAVMGRDAAQLTRLFGQPDADVREASGRKLQFVGPICVLDAYLYPKGQATPVVTWIDARETDGSPIDRASCVAALSRRSGGK